MLNCSDLKIDFSASFGSNYFVTNVEESYKWEDGKQTDILDSYKVQVVLPERNYEKITIKVSEKPDSIFFEKKNCLVTFDNLRIIFYALDGKCRFSLRADSMHVKTKNNVEK